LFLRKNREEEGEKEVGDRPSEGAIRKLATQDAIKYGSGDKPIIDRGIQALSKIFYL
jgi:hypothetical protein